MQSDIVILPPNKQISQTRDMLYGFWPKSTEQGVNLQAMEGIKKLADENQLDVVIFILSFHKMHMLAARNVVTGVSGGSPTGFSGYGLFITEGSTSWNPGLGIAKVPRLAAPFASIAIELYWTKPPYSYMGGSGPSSMGVAGCANVPDFKFPANIDAISMSEINQIEDDLKLLVDQLVDATLANAGIL